MIPSTADSHLFLRYILFKTLFRWLRAYCFFVGLFVTLCGVGILLQLFSSPKSLPELSSDQSIILHLKLDGGILKKSEEGSSPLSFLANYWKGTDFYLPSLETSLRKAAQDPRVQGVFLEFQQFHASLSEVSELRSYLSSFKKISGGSKWIKVWAPSLDSKNYYLASVADHISLAPEGDLMLSGPQFNLTYFGGLLKNLGVGVDVFQSGRYKSAVEPFSADDPSEATREVLSSIQKNMIEHLAEEIALSRHKKPADILENFRHSIYRAPKAKELGLIDQLEYRRDLVPKNSFPSTPSAKEPEKKVPFYPYPDYEKLVLSSQISAVWQENSSGIALIELAGEIHLEGGASDADPILPRLVHKQLRWAEENESVKVTILRISSPGGSALASDLIWDDVRRLAEKKPLIVSMGDLAASGGYYIAAPATKIFASPYTLTGSIGVIGLFPDFEVLGKKVGISFHSFSSSDRKNLFGMGNKLTPRDKAIMQEQSDDFYKTFVGKVIAGRGAKVGKPEVFAEGRVWTGLQAKALGLVDEIGGWIEVLAEAKRYANIPEGEEVQLLRYHAPSLRDCLMKRKNLKSCFEQNDGADVASGPLEALFIGEKAKIETLLNAEKEPWQALSFIRELK